MRRARLAGGAAVVAAVVAVLIARCACRAPADVAATLRGLRWEIACVPKHGEFCTAVVDQPVVTAALAGDPARQYDVTLRFRGAVETEAYTGGQADDRWYVGGRPDNWMYNIYELRVSAPAAVFYLNAGQANLARVWLLDYQRTIRIQGGATVTLSADAQDHRLVANVDDNGAPIVVAGVPPAPAPFDGQFIQMDVVSVSVAPAR